MLAGAASGQFDAPAAAMGFAAALAYTTYILVGDRVVAGIPLLALAALVCTGATVTFALAAVARGGPELGFSAAGWGWIGAIALDQHGVRDPHVLRRAGARRPVGGGDPVRVRAGRDGRRWPRSSSASRSAAVQVAGGALVLAAVVVVQWPAARGGRELAPA